MKYLLAVLSTALLLISCSNGDTPINLGESTAETADVDTTEANATDTDGDSETSEEPVADSKNVSDSGSDSENDSEDDKKPDTEGAEQKNVKLEIESQTTAGQIKVKKVATSRDGWVSIHKSREDGSIVLPESIGEARVDSGDSENIIVDLWEAPYIDEKLWVLLHIDAGERGIYEFPDKDLAIRRNGEIMARSFKIKGEKKDEE